jgi:hypothetical protein
MNNLIRHWCENCGKEEYLTSDQGYDNGWDFPPRFGGWGVVSQRTCPDCTIDTTAWFALTISGKKLADLSDKHRRTIQRILAEKK